MSNFESLGATINFMPSRDKGKRKYEKFTGAARISISSVDIADVMADFKEGVIWFNSVAFFISVSPLSFTSLLKKEVRTS